MRAARIKPLAATAEGTYGRLVNRTTGRLGDFPFGGIEPESFILRKTGSSAAVEKQT